MKMNSQSAQHTIQTRTTVHVLDKRNHKSPAGFNALHGFDSDDDDENDVTARSNGNGNGNGDGDEVGGQQAQTRDEATSVKVPPLDLVAGIATSGNQQSSRQQQPSGRQQSVRDMQPSARPPQQSARDPQLSGRQPSVRVMQQSARDSAR